MTSPCPPVLDLGLAVVRDAIRDHLDIGRPSGEDEVLVHNTCPSASNYRQNVTNANPSIPRATLCVTPWPSVTTRSCKGRGQHL